MQTQLDKQLPVVLIPSYKPDQQLIDSVAALLKQCALRIVIVDDGNQTDSAQAIFQALAQEPQVTVLHHPVNLGKGAALKTGMRYVQSAFPQAVGCVTADADGQHRVIDILAVAQQLELEPDCFIMGTRQFNQPDVPLRSRFGNVVTAHLFRIMTGVRCDDTQTGLRGIPASAFDSVLAVPGQRFDYEMNQLLEVVRQRLPLRLVPIQTVYLDGNQSSHFSPVRDSLRIMKTILQFGLASSIGTVIDIGLFSLLMTYFLGTSAQGILISSVVARLISGVVNYHLNLHWVFKTKHQPRVMWRYIGLFVGLMLTSSLLVAYLPFAGSHKTLLKIVVDVGLFIFSYQVQKHYVFAAKTTSKRKELSAYGMVK